MECLEMIVKMYDGSSLARAVIKPIYRLSGLKLDEKANTYRMVKLYNRISIVKAGDLVFDIGANVGNFTAAFLEKGARVVAVEPQPACAESMRKRFGNEKNLTIVRKGIGDRPGNLRLSVAGVSSTFSSDIKAYAEKEKKVVYEETQVECEITTLDALIKEFGCPKYCKLDIEGFEKKALDGLSSKADVISFEYMTFNPEKTQGCLARLSQIGYTKFNYLIHGYDEKLESPQWLSYDEIIAMLGKNFGQAGRIDGDIFAK